MTLSRRSLLGLLAGSGAAALSGCGLSDLTGQTAEFLASRAPLPRPFRVPLPVPPVKRPSRTEGGTDYYEIVQRVAEAEILPGLRTPILSYDGIFPGPTIVGTSGRRAVVRHRNELPVPVAVHLHGGHTPADSDGFATDLVLPVEGWTPPAGAGHGDRTMMRGDVSTGFRDYVYPHDQRAATLWYHDHRMDFTGPQVYRGLAGFHLVHDDEERALPLPDGERDIPLMICDRAFEADGSFRYPAVDRTLQSTPGVERDYMEGVAGDVILVNGAPWPVLEVEAARYRFRILNASNARRYRLAMTLERGAGPAFVQIGSDGGLLERPDRASLARPRLGRTRRRRGRLLRIRARHAGNARQPARPRPDRSGAAVPGDTPGQGRRPGARPVSARSSGSTRRRPSVPGSGGSAAATSTPTAVPWGPPPTTTANAAAGRSTTRRSTRAGWTPAHGWATSRSGGSSPTCTIRCTCTSTRSRSSTEADGGLATSTGAGRTRST